MSRKVLAALGAGLALTVGVAACGSSSHNVGTDSAGKPIVKIMVGGLSKQIYLPAMLAQQLGFYAQQGLDVRLSDEPAGVNAETDMVAGQVDAVVGFYDHNLDLQAKGKSTEAVVQLLQVPGEVELCRSDEPAITSPKDWAGKSLGITDLGSSTDFLTKYLAVRNGVPVTSIHEQGVQAGPTFIAAIQHKSIDCGMTTEPTVSQLVDTGQARVIVDSRTLAGSRAAFGGAYPASSLYMTTDFVNAHKDVVQKLANAYVETLNWIQTHTADQITDKMPADYYKGTGKAAYAHALQNEKGIFDPNGMMPADGPHTVQAVLSAFNPAIKGVDVSKTYTNDFVKVADQKFHIPSNT
ncbi:MAG TPA: ABC transporter substrate-binding protein [Pseudonocardiaceae bacterium]|jgi:NitT/TauT family transport system substrate-binding protein|nr:ABC transporter substrate-binding protein [Pseudonocardiaceae bacterium]